MLATRFKEDTIIEIGVDEAGRGSFWGPIMAGAVIIPDEALWTEDQRLLFKQLRDSKKISPKKRDKLADQIKELLPNAAVGIVNVDEINSNGITWANIEAFRRAIKGLRLQNDELNKVRLLIDGILNIDDWKSEQKLIIEGDDKYLAIAAASIIAKVEHDRWIQKYCEDNPECNERYNMAKCKGYGTTLHREGIKIYGAHELHRTLYIQNWLPGSIPRTKPKKTKKSEENTNKCLINFG